MAVEELRESTIARPDEGLQENQINGGSAANNGQGRRKSIVFASILGIVILVGALAFFMYSRTYETTDDAQVDGHLNGVTSRIDGVIKAVYVEENQNIQVGQLAAEMDSRNYEDPLKLEQAPAQLLKAPANLRAENPNIPIIQSSSRTNISTSQSEVSNAEAALAGAERDQA